MAKDDDCGDSFKKKTIKKKEFIVRKPKVCSSQKDLFDKILECKKEEDKPCTPTPCPRVPCIPEKPVDFCKSTPPLSDPCKRTKSDDSPIVCKKSPPDPPKTPAKLSKPSSDCLAKTVVVKNPCKDEKSDAIEKLKATSLDKINESGKKIQAMKKQLKEMDKPKPKVTDSSGMLKKLDFAALFKKLKDAMSGKGSGSPAAPGRPMKYPYTFSAKFAQFPIKFYAKNQWIWKYYFVSVAVCLPIFYSINNLANSPGNVAKWAEIRRKEAMEHHH